MKKVFNFAGLVFVGLLLTGCATDKKLLKLESSYQVQLGEYATALKSGEITKTEHDQKVTQLNGRYGRRRAMMERDIYGSCLLYTSPSPRDRSLSRMPSSA